MVCFISLMFTFAKSNDCYVFLGDEDKNKPKSIIVDGLSDKDGHKKNTREQLIEDIYVHIDNTRDVQVQKTCKLLYKNQFELSGLFLGC